MIDKFAVLEISGFKHKTNTILRPKTMDENLNLM